MSTFNPISDEDLAVFAEGHRDATAPFTSDICRRCQHRWPCPTERLVSRLRSAEAERDQMRKALSEACAVLDAHTGVEPGSHLFAHTGQNLPQVLPEERAG